MSSEKSFYVPANWPNWRALVATRCATTNAKACWLARFAKRMIIVNTQHLLCSG